MYKNIISTSDGGDKVAGDRKRQSVIVVIVAMVLVTGGYWRQVPVVSKLLLPLQQFGAAREHSDKVRERDEVARGCDGATEREATCDLFVKQSGDIFQDLESDVRVAFRWKLLLTDGKFSFVFLFVLKGHCSDNITIGC
ncbi:hypothetical protein MA16_Dca023602 [Dendrobium catenatum]|uniref:Uncharacterized protein n=1 Tax=Dendrobium catenatum TaxID=906689 RepID=A0A2I0X5Z0_9ASPA|nr:hypothetical protein MA16_Dca023602 [Dendrobium catenatum]